MAGVRSLRHRHFQHPCRSEQFSANAEKDEFIETPGHAKNEAQGRRHYPSDALP
jgi:hypothetical protein